MYVPDIDREAFRLHLVMDVIINGCTLLVPRESFENCGDFKTELKTTQDYELWFRFSEFYKFIHIPEVLVKSRLHPQQDTVKLRPLAIKECNELCTRIAKSITKKEIKAAYSKPVPIFYFDYARSMMNQGYKKSGAYSYFKGLTNILNIRPGYFMEYLRKSLSLGRTWLSNLISI